MLGHRYSEPTIGGFRVLYTFAGRVLCLAVFCGVARGGASLMATSAAEHDIRAILLFCCHGRCDKVSSVVEVERTFVCICCDRPARSSGIDGFVLESGLS